MTSRRAQVIVAKGRTLDYNRRPEYNLIITVGDNQNREFSTIRRYSAVPVSSHLYCSYLTLTGAFFFLFK